MRSVVVFLLLGLPLGLQAQRPTGPDSLRAWLRRPNLPDTVRVKALLNCGYGYMTTHPDSTIWYTEQALALAHRLRLRGGEGLAQSQLGAAYYYTSNYPAAQRAFEQALRLGQRLGRAELVGNAYLGLGNVATELRNAPAAQAYFAQAQQTYAAMRPRFVRGELLVLYNRTNGYLDVKDMAHARALTRQQLALLRRFPGQASRAKVLGQLGMVQQRQHQPDSAAATWQADIGVARREHNTQAEGEAWQHLAELAGARQNYPAVLGFAQQAGRSFRALGDDEPLADALRLQARALAALHRSGAYDTLLRAATLRDTLYNQQRLQAVADAQARFSQVEQQARIQVLEQQRRIAALETTQRQFRSRLEVAAGAGLLLLLAGLGWWAYRRRQAAREAALRTRIAADLHDDVGSLLTQISLETEMLRDGLYTADEQPRQLHRLADASRTAVRHMNDVVWGLDARHDSMADLLDRLRDHAHEVLPPQGLDMAFAVAPAVAANPLPLPARQALYLIYKEALHNVVKHAHRATLVRIGLRLEANHLVLTVADNGQPVSTAADHRRNGHGLANMARRAAAAGGSFRGGPAAAGGFALEARLPLR